MITERIFFASRQGHSFGPAGLMAAAFLTGTLTVSAQTGQYLFTGSMTNIALNPGTYDIKVYGAQGGLFYDYISGGGAQGAEMEARFNFASNVNLTLLVGEAGGGGGADYNLSCAGGGGGGSFVVLGSTPLVVAGGGGGAGFYSQAGSGVVGTNGDYGGGSSPVYGGIGGAGGDYATGSFYGGGGGGGYSGDGVGDAGQSGGAGGSSFLDGGAGGSGGNGEGSFANNGNGGFGGGGGGGFDFTYNNGAYIVLASGGGGGGGFSGGGGGTGNDNHYLDGGGGGGSIIDSSAISIVAEVAGAASPDGSPNGEIIITSVPPPITMALAFTAGQFELNINGPTNANIVVEGCTNLAAPDWIPLATNTLNNGISSFSDTHWTDCPIRFYRVREP
jgi:hypothetical protein